MSERVQDDVITAPLDEQCDVRGADAAPAGRVGDALHLGPPFVEGERPQAARLVVVPDRDTGVEVQGRERPVVCEIH